MRIAILDDYHNVVRANSDWSRLYGRCTIDTFSRPLSSAGEDMDVLSGYDIICTMRERMALPGEILERLPRLKLIAITGNVHRTLDLVAATRNGIVVCHTEAVTCAASELAWSLLLALARDLPRHAAEMRDGRWNTRLGVTMEGKIMGIVGLGRNGVRVARIAAAFGMEVVAWSPNLTLERAAAAGARLVGKSELFELSDFISLHLVLGPTTRRLIGAQELSRMKTTAYLVNTSRAAIVDETALIDALKGQRIAGAALDVFETEPLPVDHRLRFCDNVILTPHVGYYTQETISRLYGEVVENIEAFLDGRPQRISNPDVKRDLAL